MTARARPVRSSRRELRPVLGFVLACVAVAIAACGGSSPPGGGSTAAPSAPATAAPPPAGPPSPPAAPPAAPPAVVAMPNPALTPGETFAGATAPAVCAPGYARSVRQVAPAQYREVYAEYGIPYPEPPGTYELDHLVPLELGGDNANANLWPQPASPAPGYHQKDVLENTMHDLVCAGRLDLHQAQQEIAAGWYAAYLRYVGG